MKVIISAGDRFHAINLAAQLQKRDLLLKLFSFSYRKSDQIQLPREFVDVIKSCKLLDILFSKFRISKLANRAAFNSYKDDIFDFIVSNEIKNINKIDLFIGWSNYSLKSMQLAKQIGAKLVIEAGSSHILEQKELMEIEYEKWGINFTPVHKRTETKICKEYEEADYVMTLSEYSRQSFIKHGVSKSKVLMVPCGIDVDFFLNNNISVSKVKFRVIFVGLLCLRKGIQYLIQAWNELNIPKNMAELVLVGCIQKDFLSLIPKLNPKKNIIFAGSFSRVDLKKLYENSSVFVLPSIEDGFGMVVGEAMASGLPVICSKNVGATEIVNENINGFIVPAASVQALANKILWCYQNQNELYFMGKNARTGIENWSWDCYGDKIVNIYEDILKDRGGK